ncbi:hypothetical protein WMF38_32160 [Sorangium sp. So ce118]
MLRDYVEKFIKQSTRPAETAEEAFRLLSNRLNYVEDAYSGITAVANPGLQYTGRMYPPMADMTKRLADGSIEAMTKGQRLVFGSSGSISIFSRKTGELLFSKAGR